MDAVGLTDEQKAGRKHSIGASEIAAVVGLSPWMSAFDLWAQKMGYAPSEPGTDAQEFGTHLEPAILSIYNVRVGPCVGNRETFRHPEHTWATATPDGFARDVIVEADGRESGYTPTRLIECKAVSGMMRREWGDGEDEAPVHYLLQTQWQMFVCGYRETDLAALIGLEQFRHYRIQRDDELIEYLVEAGETFWRKHVLTGDPPEIGESGRTSRILAAMYPKQKRPLAGWTAEARKLAEECAAHKRAKALAEKAEEETANRLKLLIGDGEGFSGGKGEPKCTWRADKQGKVAWAALAKELGAPDDLIEKHRGSPGRTLRFAGLDTGEESTEE